MAWLGEPIPDKVEDGILLAEEIADLDLGGTEILVLSASRPGTTRRPFKPHVTRCSPPPNIRTRIIGPGLSL